MEDSRFSLIIALLPSLNMQKMRQNEPLFALISYWTWHNMAKDIAMSTLNQYILCPLSSYCPSPSLVLSNLSRRIVKSHYFLTRSTSGLTDLHRWGYSFASLINILRQDGLKKVCTFSTLYLYVLQQKHPSSKKLSQILPVSQIF